MPHTEKRFCVLPILNACALITWKFEEGKPEKFDDGNKINYYQNKFYWEKLRRRPGLEAVVSDWV